MSGIVPASPRILVSEDEAPLRDFVCRNLRARLTIRRTASYSRYFRIHLLSWT